MRAHLLRAAIRLRRAALRLSVFVAPACLAFALVCAVKGHGETVTVDPSRVEVSAWEGWGCSLSWWGVFAEHWDEKARAEVCRRLFSSDADSLGLRICRYNAGGSSPSMDPRAFRLGGRVPVTLDQDGSWHPERDRAQLECLKLARRFGANRFELFVNSPPTWMLRNGNTRGGPAGRDNLKPECEAEYADWLVRVTRLVEAACGLKFESISPFNEPSAWWWNGDKGNQEGCSFSRPAQARVLRALRTALDRARRRWLIAASDENGATDGYRTLDWLTSGEGAGQVGGTLDGRSIGRLNVHSYHGWDWQDRLRDLAVQRGIRRTWMSEVSHREWENAGFVPYDMRSALPMSRSIVSDIKHLRCQGWVYWQAVEPLQYDLWYHYTYGLLPAAVDTPVEWEGRTYRPGEFVVTKGFHTMRQFTQFIKQGDRLVSSGDEWSLAALSPTGNRLTVVVHNDSRDARPYSFELGQVGEGLRAARVWRTKDDQGTDRYDCRRLPDLTVQDGRFRDTVPGRSVTTYVLDVPARRGGGKP